MACACTVQADDLTWNGEATSNVWNTEATNMPWQNATPEAAPFAAGDNVSFGVPTGTVTTTVQVGEALEAGTVTVADGYTFTTTAESSISGEFAGAGTLSKSGEYLLTLTAAEDTAAGPALAVAEGNLALGGTGTYRALSSMATGTGLTVAEGAAITFSEAVNGTDVALQGAMSLESGDSVLESLNGAGSLQLADVATLALSADSSVGTLSNAGTLTSSANLLIEKTVETGGTVEAARLILNGGGNFTTLKTDNLVLGAEISQTAPSVTTQTLGAYSGESMDVEVARLVRGSGDYTLVAATDMGDTTYTLSEGTMARFLDSGYKTTLSQTAEGLVLNLETTNTHYYERHTRTANGRAGGELADFAFDLLDPQANSDKYRDLSAALNALDAYIASGNGRGADSLAANMAGAGIANLNVAWRDQMGRQLNSIRNRMTSMNGGIPCHPVDPKAGVASPLKYTMWAAAEIDYHNQDGETATPGYTLNSIGGTAGVAMLADEDMMVGAAFTGMAGRFGSKGYGSNASGDLDAYYASLFVRKDVGCWNHSLIGSVGFADMSLNRRVNFPGGGYETRGSTDGLGFGLMYEVAKTYRISEDSVAGAWWQPVFNISYIHSSVDGYTERGSDAALRVGKQESDNVIFGLGARMQGVVGENVLNTPAIMETRILGKAIAGRREGSAHVGIPGINETVSVHGSDPGAFGVELGIGFDIPLGKDRGSLIMDCSAEFFSDQTSVNGVLGYRLDF